MSRSADDRDELRARDALGDLEEVLGRLLEELDRLRDRARTAERRVEDVESLLRNFTTGADDPARLHRRMAEVEAENRELREKIQEGRAGVERLLGRIRFLEEQR